MDTGGSGMRYAWQRLVDGIDYAVTQTRLRVLDWIVAPLPETEADRIREARQERLRRAFPNVGAATSQMIAANNPKHSTVRWPIMQSIASFRALQILED